jgi:hypothetical protein
MLQLAAHLASCSSSKRYCWMYSSSGKQHTAAASGSRHHSPALTSCTWRPPTSSATTRPLPCSCSYPVKDVAPVCDAISPSSAPAVRSTSSLLAWLRLRWLSISSPKPATSS